MDEKIIEQLKIDTALIEHLKFHIYTNTLAIKFIESKNQVDEFRIWSQKYNSVIEHLI